jgi:carbamoylphosphate synthase large subunit
MRKLPEESIDGWETFERVFVQNFKSTCKKPVSIEQLRACVQKSGESMRAYIQRCSIIKNTAEHVSDERAIDAFWGHPRNGPN